MTGKKAKSNTALDPPSPSPDRFAFSCGYFAIASRSFKRQETKDLNEKSGIGWRWATR